MPKPVLRFNIFISCPGDVDAEKDRLITFFKNAEAALIKKGIPGNLRALYWKDIVHEHDGVRGQTIINKEFDDYDHYIGILAARFGTKTTTEEGITYGSGTEEEFRIAVEKKKAQPELGLYFFIKRVTEPTDPDKKIQYDQVVKFKKEIYETGWVNSFSDPVDLSDQLNVDLIPKIEDAIRKYQTGQVSTFIAEAEAKEVATADGSVMALVTLTEDIPVVEIERPIPRTVAVEEDDEISRMLFSEKYNKELTQLVTDHHRIVLLGNAGSGKSTELAKLVEFYQKPGSLYVPVFARLNTYKGGPLFDYLPEEFINVPENTALVVLDGLDEVEPENFNQSINEIEKFSQEHPLCKLVISCRTNFFELSVGGSKGYLQSFVITRMNEITPAAIIQSMNASGLDGNGFIVEVYNGEYQEIVTKPFFLNILSAVYQKQGNLQGGRAKIFDEAINLKLEEAAVNDGLSEEDMQRCEDLLTRLSLIMEFMGRNYLTTEEFHRTIGADADRQIIEKSILFTPFKGRWTFEHNNIQEYFAARALSPLAIDQIKTFVSFYPEHIKIKPSWLNTLSFLISIAEDDKRQQLLEWIITNEPEAVIRFEPDRVDANIRLRVFSAIFREFQENGLPVRSNKFTEAELGRFGNTPESLTLVKDAIGKPGNSVSNKITALRLLEYFTLNNDDDKNAVKQVILKFIEQHEDKPDAVYAAVHVLVRCNLADQQTIDELVARYRWQTDPYYRAALYTLITKTGQTARYIDVFMEGIIMIGKRNQEQQKSTLWDETAQLKRAFANIHDPKAIDAALDFFAEPYDERYRRYSDKRDVLESLIHQAAGLFADSPYLYDRAFSLFVNYSKTHDRDVLIYIRQFFEETGTLTKAFYSIFQDNEIPNFQKQLLLSLLLNNESIEFIITEVEAGRAKTQEVAKLAEEAFHHTRNTTQAAAAIALKQKLEERLKIIFDDAAVATRQDKRRQQEQDSFNLLFDEPAFKAEVERFWKEFGKEEAEWKDIWEFANRSDYDPDDYFPRSVTTIISEWSRDRDFVSKDDTIVYMSNAEYFENERVDSIYNMMKNAGLKPSEQQTEFLEDWAKRTAAKIDIKTSIDEWGRFNPLSVMLLYFVKHLDIKLPDEKLLDFTLFFDTIHSDIENWYGPILKQVGEEALNNRIIGNLKSGIKSEHVWTLNAEYAIEKGLEESFPAIKEDLVRIIEITSVKENIAKIYLEATDDQDGLFEVLQKLPPQDFRWDLVDLLVKGKLIDKIHSYLLDVLHSDKEDTKDKLAAAKRLTAMADEEGFTYYADHGFEKRDIVYRDDLWLSYLTNLKTLNFLPRLIQLLEQSLAPENVADSFTRYDGKILDALFNMGLQSEDNLKAVTAAVENIIAKRAPDLNYLMTWLKQLDFQHKMNLSADVSLNTAMAAVNALGYY
ncbi:type IV secretory pathway ATPase VirB11/archaellum biosynthesis ATPase [Mucilaginibacter rubeus]|uniref:NACHT domain-containing protein n=1 Tax=Mucilaginibacter rubeus TaxID=2027860 RepID=UPI003395FB4A